MKINKKKILHNFKKIKNFANFNLLKCGNVLFSKKGLSGNAGFYIFIAIIAFHTIVIILFYLKKLDLLLNKIKEIILAIKYLKLKNSPRKEVLKREEKNREIMEMESKDKSIEVFRIRMNKISNKTKMNKNQNNTDIINNYKLNSDIVIIDTKKIGRNVRNILTEKNDTNKKFDEIKKF